MKKTRMILAAVLTLVMMLCLCACGEDQADPTTTAAPTTAAPTVAPTTVPPTTKDDGLAEYKIMVVYPDGTPAAGVTVQLCLDDLCQMPVKTDENGVAIYKMPEMEGYKVKLTKKLDGYVHEDYIYYEEGAHEITIYLVAEDAA